MMAFPDTSFLCARSVPSTFLGVRNETQMRRRQKPPGAEKWTWHEIDEGYKMSKSERRLRRTLVSLGAKEKPGGGIEHSAESKSFATAYAALVVALAVLAVVASIVARCL